LIGLATIVAGYVWIVGGVIAATWLEAVSPAEELTE
jgi:hypothetical protein